jgi:peptidyl-prolyl cis-trans isomerase C
MGEFMKRILSLFVIVPVCGLALSSCKKETAGAGSSPATTAAATATAATPNAAAPPAGAPPAGAPGLPGAPPAAKPMPANIPAVLAKVNGESIERWEFDNAVRRTEARAGGPVPPERRDEVLRGILDQLVAYHLLAQESRARKLDVPQTEIDARLAQIRQSFPTEDAFKQNIAAQGLTLDQVKAQTKSSIEVAKVIDAEINSKVNVTDQDADAFYNGNLERFKQGDTVHAAHILYGISPQATPEQKAEAKAKAQAALKKLRAGADFAALAKAESQDPGSAPNGGDLGFFPKGQMTPVFEQAAFTLKKGATSGVIETPFGFHIIKVIDKRGPRTAPLAEVKDQIEQFLTQQQREQKLEVFVGQIKAKGKIQILV